uniref:(northern house mosquito) hypothetical protein n=1 Tax=Culex pipiens TaxID=7175 RepID=A0A8D8FEM1_CULPI
MERSARNGRDLPGVAHLQRSTGKVVQNARFRAKGSVSSERLGPSAGTRDHAVATTSCPQLASVRPPLQATLGHSRTNIVVGNGQDQRSRHGATGYDHHHPGQLPGIRSNQHPRRFLRIHRTRRATLRHQSSNAKTEGVHPDRERSRHPDIDQRPVLDGQPNWTSARIPAGRSGR